MHIRDPSAQTQSQVRILGFTKMSKNLVKNIFLNCYIITGYNIRAYFNVKLITISAVVKCHLQL